MLHVLTDLRSSLAGERVIIEAEGLVKHYGKVKAVDDVSFSVKEGETFGLLGPNGGWKDDADGDSLRLKKI
jgi:ABC-type glutathione transport system ATPase component